MKKFMLLTILFCFRILNSSSYVPSNKSVIEKKRIVNKSYSDKSWVLVKIQNRVNEELSRIKRQNDYNVYDDYTDEKDNKSNSNWKIIVIISSIIGFLFIFVISIILFKTKCCKKKNYLQEKDLDFKSLSCFRRKVYLKLCFYRFSCLSKNFTVSIQVPSFFYQNYWELTKIPHHIIILFSPYIPFITFSPCCQVGKWEE